MLFFQSIFPLHKTFFFQQMGGNVRLLTVKSDNEAAWIVEKMQETGINKVWVGLNNVNGVLKWQDGTGKQKDKFSIRFIR